LLEENFGFGAQIAASVQVAAGWDEISLAPRYGATPPNIDQRRPMRTQSRITGKYPQSIPNMTFSSVAFWHDAVCEPFNRGIRKYSSRPRLVFCRSKSPRCAKLNLIRL
jgi:hypothetical protein